MVRLYKYDAMTLVDTGPYGNLMVHVYIVLSLGNKLKYVQIITCYEWSNVVKR